MESKTQPSQKKPILALDVDGPIVIFGSHHTEETLDTRAGEIPVTVSRKIASRLRVLHRHFQIVWSSSWQRTAGEFIAPIVGLPGDLPFIDFDKFPAASLGQSRKLPGLKAWLRRLPVAIVDDEIGEDMKAWAAERDVPTLLVEIDPRTGILDSHTIELIAFSRKIVR